MGQNPENESFTPFAAPEGASELEQLQQAVAAAEAQAQAARDQALRALAELENVRKRAQRDVENAHRYALEKFAQELLPVKDSLDLAIESAGRADAAALVEGQAATQRLLAKALERGGIVELNPLGEPFDANLHEAMAAQPSDTAEPNSVLAVVQRGYTLNGRLLRAARVIVARAPG
ncbi:MAG: nucleotide exchange factor GrpE [Gammaproteobacteria bacterium]|jgi:molecular chaperone GrpE|nr:nucleotide exchange factor GrpE [Gammaproteobacteria bacterium]